MFMNFNLEHNERWYERRPAAKAETEKLKLPRDIGTQTDTALEQA